VPYSVVSSTRHSPTSKITARIIEAAYLGASVRSETEKGKRGRRWDSHQAVPFLFLIKVVIELQPKAAPPTFGSGCAGSRKGSQLSPYLVVGWPDGPTSCGPPTPFEPQKELSFSTARKTPVQRD
jgi:hypothetical protein